MLKTVCQCLLLSLLSAPCTAGPVGAHSMPVRFSRSTCPDSGRALLQNVRDALETDKLFRGLNCTEQSAELRGCTRTLSVCTPQNVICFEGTDFTFDQDECLQSVLEDLRYYWATFKSYPDPDRILKQSVLRNIESLVQSCFSVPLLDGAQVQGSVDNVNSFEKRLKLCKVLKGFQIRTVTINRVLNHIAVSSEI